ncbi:hypothetical protein [Streptomyces spiramenti]|nr:hypothetical protein [Streptomyces spiramenti]
MVHGTLTVLVTGIALVGLDEAGDGEVNHVEATLTAAVPVAVLARVVAPARGGDGPSPLLGRSPPGPGR